MLRITVAPAAAGGVLLFLSGRLGSAEVEVLQTELQQRSGPPVALDLAAVLFIDEAGICLLAHWVSQGLKLRGGSVFIRRLLTDRGLLEA